MTNRQLNFGIRIATEGGAASAAEAEKVRASFAGIGVAAEQANRKIEMSARQTAFAMRQLPAQMTDIAVGLASGQSPFMVLMQQGGQLRDVFGGIGPAIGAVAGYAGRMINPFTVAAAAVGTLGYALHESFGNKEEPVKALKTAVGELSATIGEVGKVSRDFSMDNLYKQFNKASAAARQGIIDHVRFQQVLIETQNIQAQKSLSKSLEGIGDYGFFDKMRGAFAESGSEKFSREMGVSLAAARDMLTAIRGLRNGTEDAENFMARFGIELARSSRGGAQQLLADIRAVASGSKDAAAAQSRYSEALEKMKKAGVTGEIEIPGKLRAETRESGFEDARVAANRAYAKSIEDLIGIQARAISSEKDLTAAEQVRQRLITSGAWERLAPETRKIVDAFVDEANAAIRSAEAKKAAQKANEDLLKSAEALYAATQQGAFDKFSADLKTAEEAFRRGFIDQDKLDAITRGLFDVGQAGKDTFSDLTRAVEGWGKSASAAFADFVFTGKGSFSDLVAHMLREAATMMAYKTIFEPLFGMMGDWMKTALPSFGGGRASGGAVYPGKYYVVGENGPELLVPGTSGMVIPNRGGGGMASGGNVNVSVAVDASGSRVRGDSEQAGALGKRIAAAVRAVLIDEKRPGGILAA